MTRQIRLKRAEAMALGLLDPKLRMAGEPSERGRSGPRIVAGAGASLNDAPPESCAAPAAALIRRQSRSRKTPLPAAPPPGSGSVDCDIDGVARSVSLRVDLVPVPKERARTVRTGESGKVMSYTPKRTADFSADVRRVAEDVFAGHAPFAGPVGVEILFLMPIPKSWPRWKREAARSGLIEPTGRPDMDNLEKAFLDAVKGLIFTDDALLTRWNVGKSYAEVPGIAATYVARRTLGIHATRIEVEALMRAQGLDDARA